MREDGSRPRGPLHGLRVIELAGLAPAPFACMMLADLGADVLRIDRAAAGPDGARPTPVLGSTDVLGRGRRAVALDLKRPESTSVLLSLVERADVLVEGFRPGVAERLGIGPEPCLARNPALVYGRMTGWGNHGPLAQAAGHDIDYIALTGALHLAGSPDGPPLPPANLLGDFGGGGMLLAFGVLAALFERSRSGLGQVVDAAMVDGVALLTTMLHGLAAVGEWTDARGTNMLAGAAPFYTTYATSDGAFVAVGAVEPHFYAELLSRLGLDDVAVDAQHDVLLWPATREKLQAVFSTRTRDEWCALLEGTDACFAPVLTLQEAPRHPHNRERAAYVEVDGVVQPAAAPRFSRTPAPIPASPLPRGGEGLGPLLDWQVPHEEVAQLLAAGAVVTSVTSGDTN